MYYTTSSTGTWLRRLAVPILVAASLTVAGCSSDDDEQDLAEPTGLTNIQPGGAARLLAVLLVKPGCTLDECLSRVTTGPSASWSVPPAIEGKADVISTKADIGQRMSPV